jgi:hypothetical protein
MVRRSEEFINASALSSDKSIELRRKIDSITRDAFDYLQDCYRGVIAGLVPEEEQAEQALQQEVRQLSSAQSPALQRAEAALSELQETHSARRGMAMRISDDNRIRQFEVIARAIRPTN